MNLYEEHCSQWISEKHPVFYRGKEPKIVTFEKFPPILDRKPRYVSVIYDRIVEKIREEINPKAVSRSHAAFATQSKANASKFGSIYLFMPCNGYTFCYNQGVEDLNDVYKMSKDSLNKFVNLEDVEKMTIKDIRTKILQGDIVGIKDDDRLNAINSFDQIEKYWKEMVSDIMTECNNEFLFECPNGYYLVNENFANKIK